MQIFRSKFSILAFALFAALFAFSSCRKNAEDIAALLSDTEAAEIAEAAVAGRTAGAAMPAVDMSAILASVPQTCGVPGDTSFQKAIPPVRPVTTTPSTWPGCSTATTSTYRKALR